MPTTTRISLVISLFSLFFLSACGISHRYGTGDVSTVPTLAGQRMVVPAVLDARDNGHATEEPSFVGEDRNEELSEISESVQEHVALAGIAPVERPAAPRSSDEARAILDAAAVAGASEVLFVRYHGTQTGQRCSHVAESILLGVVPFFVFESLPLSRRAANAGFEAFVVDPRSGEVLASPAHLAASAERLNQWRCAFGPQEALMQDMMRDAVQALLEDIGRERADGYPNRFLPDDVAGFVVSAPQVRQNGQWVRGLGWSHPLPAGWTFSRDVGERGGARSPSGTELTAAPGWCIGGTQGCAALVRNQLASEGAVIVDAFDMEIGGAPVTQIETRRTDGKRELIRVSGTSGIMLVSKCVADEDAPEHDFGTCEQAFDRVQLTVLETGE